MFLSEQGSLATVCLQFILASLCLASFPDYKLLEGQGLGLKALHKAGFEACLPNVWTWKVSGSTGSLGTEVLLPSTFPLHILEISLCLLWFLQWWIFTEFLPCVPGLCTQGAMEAPAQLLRVRLENSFRKEPAESRNRIVAQSLLFGFL